MEDFNHKAVNYIIANGGVRESNLGDYFCYDTKKTKAMIKDIAKNGIDWDKTGSVYDTYASEFDGTEEPLKDTAVIGCLIISNSGKLYRAEYKVECELITLIRDIHSCEHLHTAIDMANKRLGIK